MNSDSNLVEVNQQDDDLLNDLMNIVQNEDDQANSKSELNSNQINKYNSESEEDDFLDEDEDEANEEEIDQLLEKPIDILDNKKNDQVNYYVYDKLQIKNIYWRGSQDSQLPEGWVQVTHASGMPLYLNRQQRVCTLSRPYYIGQSSARKHDIPTSAIPCLAYKKRKETIEKQIKEHQEAKLQQQQQQQQKCPFSSQEKEQNNKKITVSITSNEEKIKENNLTPEQLNEYCKLLFEFDIVKVKKFKTWSDRKKYNKKSKQKKFPENAKMLKIQTKTQKGINKELNINMTNKTPLCILYEYANQVFKTNPRFEIQEKENPKDPFQAVCYINEKVCGKGNGNSKKAAKNAAAEAALNVLIPDFKGQFESNKKNNDEIYSFFDSYNVEHTHVHSLSQKLGAPMPYDVLLTCLKYNFAINMSRNRKQFIEEEIKPIKYRNCLYKMKLAQYEVEVNCTKKKEGRQLAAQKILKQMHPHIQTWGSILRLYGSKLEDTLLNNNTDKLAESEESKSNEQVDSTKPQAQKAKPNKELLDKLKEEMRKLKKSVNSIPSENNFDQKDTLLTIPPLLLGDNDFKFSFNSNENENKIEPKSENDDMIMFTDNDKKRKLSTSSSSSSSSSDSESDTTESDYSTSSTQSD